MQGSTESEGAKLTACSGRAWELPEASTLQSVKLAQDLQIPDWIAGILLRRGIASPADAEAYLNPSFDQLHSPALLCGMAAAVERILRAVQQREPILIYGDYDVDGTLATVLLKTAIDRVTPREIPSLVRYHIPHRIREGYGMQTRVLADAAELGVRLVVSVDTGIRAFVAADEARTLGLDLIVTDHHLPDDRGVPEAVAVINPNQAGCLYPEKHLCGAAVAYKLAEAVLRAAGTGSAGLRAVDPASLQPLRASLLKLAAIATVADAVPLTGENRAIVALGLREMREVHQAGLKALLRLAQVELPPRAEEIAFRVAPRINAAGRMDVADDVVRLLLTRDQADAEATAAKLHRLNDERRATEAAVLQEIEAQFEAMLPEALAQRPPAYVLDGAAWHRGVIGILASRVVDRTSRPALVITHEDGAAYGSGRSVDGFHLLEAITEVHREHREHTSEDLFLRFGGHAHAVGFSLASAAVPSLRERLVRYAGERGMHRAPAAPLRLDAELPLQRADADAWQWLCRLQPFGNGNGEPVLLARGVVLQEVRVIKERHWRLRLRSAEGQVIGAICWARSFSWPERAAECGLSAGSLIDVAYQLRWNSRPEFGGLEVVVCDLRPSENPNTRDSAIIL